MFKRLVLCLAFLTFTSCANDQKEKVAYCEASVDPAMFDFRNGLGLVKSDYFTCTYESGSGCELYRWVNDPTVEATDCEGIITTDGRGNK